jgi:iron complex transport system substrate-binding protein
MNKLSLTSALTSAFLLFLYNQVLATPRYISLAPATTEILFALGLDEEIVGVSSYCDYPAKTKEKDKFGTFSDPNIEKVLSLKPDIVFATGLEQAPAVIRLEKLGIKVCVSDPKNIEELLQSVNEIGRITHKEKEAGELVVQMQKRIEVVKEKAKGVPKEKRPRVFIEIWHDPLMTAGPGSIVNEILGLAGGENIAYDAPRAYSRFSAEVIIKRNPQVIILGYMSKENTNKLVSKRLGWQDISAVKNKRIVSNINPDLILRPGPRLVEGLEEIYRCLYEK